MTNVKDIYKALAVRINYPVQPTYRCLEKVIGYINLLLSLTNTHQILACLDCFRSLYLSYKVDL